MNVNDYLEPSKLLKAAIILENLQHENSSNLNGTFPHGREVIVELMAISMKKYKYYFIECVDELKKEYQDKTEGLNRFNEYSYVEKAFNIAMSCTEDELLLSYIKKKSTLYKIGFNAAALAYALTKESASITYVNSWLHGLAAGYTSDYITNSSGDSCELAKDLIVVALKAVYEYNLDSVKHINKNFKFIIEDLASNYGFNPEDVLLNEKTFN
jgi:hypothetical protein